MGHRRKCRPMKLLHPEADIVIQIPDIGVYADQIDLSIPGDIRQRGERTLKRLRLSLNAFASAKVKTIYHEAILVRSRMIAREV